MLEIIYNKVRNVIRKIDMRLERAKYGYIEKLPSDIKYFDGGLYDAVYEASCKHENNTALEYGNLQVTYKEMIKKINKVARSLKALGIEKGDTVTICMPNTPEAVYMFYAINEVGAVASMIHPLSSPAEIENYLNQSHSKAMLCIDVSYSRVEPIIKNTELKHIIVVSATRSMEFFVKILYWITKGRKNHVKKTQVTLTWQRFLMKADKFIGNPHTRVNSDDLAVILYSGGTTGTPKGVMLSNLNFNAQALESKYYAPKLLVPSHAFLTFLPNFHAFGLGICTHIPLYWGMRVVLIPQFSAKKLKNYLRKYKFNIICGVPAVYDYLLKIKFGKNELKGLRGVISGGDAMSLPQMQKVNKYLQEHGCKVNLQVGYGLTEATGVVAFSPMGITDAADVIGYAFPDCKFFIRDLKTDKEAEVGCDGEILLSGPTVMLGYLNNAKETKESFVTIKGTKYLKTGDIGFFDEKGLLHFKARLKRMIITNGYNVYPSHVEEIIMKSKAVEKCAVVGKKNEAHGETVWAYIVWKEGKGGRGDMNELQKIMKSNLAKYEIPRMIKPLESLPLTKMNKVDYKFLAELD